MLSHIVSAFCTKEINKYIETPLRKAFKNEDLWGILNIENTGVIFYIQDIN